MAVPRTGFEPSRRSTRRQGGVTGAVDRTLGFSHHTAIEYRLLTQGRVTAYVGALPTDLASFREFGDTGLYTLDFVASRANGSIAGGAVPAWATDTEGFVAQHGTLNPAAHGQAALSANLVTAMYDDLGQIYGLQPGGWTASAAAQAELVAAGWTGVAAPVNVYAPAKNTDRAFTVQNLKHMVTTGLSNSQATRVAYEKFAAALAGGAATVTIDGKVGDIRQVAGPAPGPRASNVGAWPGAVQEAYDQFVTVTFGGIWIDVLAVYNWGLAATVRQSAGINVPTGTAGSLLRCDYFLLARHWFVADVTTWVFGTLDVLRDGIDHWPLAMIFDEVSCKTKKQLPFCRKALPKWQVGVDEHATDLSLQIQRCLANAFPIQRNVPRKSFISNEAWDLRRQRMQIRNHTRQCRNTGIQATLAAAWRCWSQNWPWDMVGHGFSKANSKVDQRAGQEAQRRQSNIFG